MSSQTGLSLAALLCLALLVFPACAGQKSESAPRPVQTCEKLYTYAPGFLVMELAAKSDIYIDPAAREFPVFCSAARAHEDLILMVSAGRIQRGDWEIYGLNGGTELGCMKNDGRMVLCKPAKIADWHPQEPIGIATSRD